MTVLNASAERRIRVRLGDLGLAPENLRFDEPADEGVPRLADTIAAAGLLYPPIVRRGRKGEGPFMVLDGRRRRFALLLRVERGEMTLDEEVECVLASGRGDQAAAAIVANAEMAPVHLADVIVAIGKLRRAKMTTQAIAAGLGYAETEVRRLEALSGVEPAVLQAFRAGRLNLRQVRLFARLNDPERQRSLAEQALAGYFHEYRLQALVEEGRVTVDDVRLRLVGLAAYAEAGGRLEPDLFGELPDVVLDPDLLGRLWRERAEAIGVALGEKDVTVLVAERRGPGAPEGLYGLPYVHIGSLPEDARAAFDAATLRLDDLLERVGAAGGTPPSEADVTDFLLAQLEAARAKTLVGTVEAAVLTASAAMGLEASFFWKPPEVEVEDEEGNAAAGASGAGPDVEDAADDPGPPQPAAPAVTVETEGVTHLLHDLRTDIATRGLIRSLADDPQAALVALTAHLFGQVTGLGGGRDRTALAITAVDYGSERQALAGLDGEVRRRLSARRDAWRASGQRPIAWVAGLDDGERLALLGDIVALCLDLREPRTTAVRRAARAEAQEIAELCQAALAPHWTPDAAFLAAHPKAQLLEMLEAMGAAEPRARVLRKDELAALVAEEAARRRWVPASVVWRAEPGAQDEADGAAAGTPDDDLGGPPSEADAALAGEAAQAPGEAPPLAA